MDKPAKAHRAPSAGRSADKKKPAEKAAEKGGFNAKVGRLPPSRARSTPAPLALFGQTTDQHPYLSLQAFAPTSGRNANLQGRRKAEKDQTRLHVPRVDRTPDDEPPPVVVAVVGPPGVGKSTLMKSLVKRFTKHNLSEIRGPVTVVSGASSCRAAAPAQVGRLLRMPRS